MYFVKYRDDDGLTWMETSDNYKDIRAFHEAIKQSGWVVVSSKLN